MSQDRPTRGNHATHALVCDDNALLRVLLHDLLTEKSFQVTVACDGVEVLEQLESGLMPDIVLLNGRMPRLDGWETTERLRSEYPGLPSLILTASPTPDAIARARRAGSNGLLGHGLPDEELLAAIDTALAGSSLFENA